MDSIAEKCPKCDCPKWKGHGRSTADAHSAWQDADGTWYDGPAKSELTRECANCGWTQRIVRKRGKLESIVSDAV